ncbi:MAG: hypothetical protein KF832_05070 [Caldilineaceae bacterium]|nr:hypothetical protein [Caldilineaceae bacterium]
MQTDKPGQALPTEPSTGLGSTPQRSTGLIPHPNRQPAADPPATLAVHIDELVLAGFPKLDGARLGVLIEEALTRLLTAGELTSACQRHAPDARIDGGVIAVRPDTPVETLAHQIAQAIYGGLDR